MDNSETQPTLGTQDTGLRQSRDTVNIGYTRHMTETIQRHSQHWVHKTQDWDNPETQPTLGTQDTGLIQRKQKPQHRKLNRGVTGTSRINRG